MSGEAADEDPASEGGWQRRRGHDGRILRIRADLASGRDGGSLPFTVRVLRAYTAAPDGMPGAAALGALDHFGVRLEEAARRARAGVLAAERAGAGVREWVWLAPSAAGLGGIVNALVHELDEDGIDVEPAHDPDRSYLRSLLPD